MIPIMIGQTDYDINMMWASLAFCLPASFFDYRIKESLASARKKTHQTTPTPSLRSSCIV